MRDWTSKTFSPNKMLSNVPTRGFVFLTDAQVDNMSVTPDNETPGEEFGIDAYEYSAVNSELKAIPQYEMAHGASVYGRYTGFVPPGFTSGQEYTFIMTFQGPAEFKE